MWILFVGQSIDPGLFRVYGQSCCKVISGAKTGVGLCVQSFPFQGPTKIKQSSPVQLNWGLDVLS